MSALAFVLIAGMVSALLLVCLCVYVENRLGFAWAFACCFFGTVAWVALLVGAMP